MQPHPMPSHPENSKPPVLVALLLTSFFILCAVGSVSGTAQSTQKEERELEDRIPKHLPLKVKVKNINNEKWYSDVEVEVTNTGNKPIYYLMIVLFFGDVTMEDGTGIGFPLRYGRPELSRIGNRATPEDVPIQPGETYVFKSHEGLAKGWDGFRAKRNMRHPKKIGIRFEILNFGDNTGFVTRGGLPVPKPRAANAPCRDDGKGSTPDLATQAIWPKRSPAMTTQIRFSLLPVSSLPATFLAVRPNEAIASVAAPQSNVCCPGTSCSYLEQFEDQGNCFCGAATETISAACSNPVGQCGTQRVEQFVCPNNEHSCTNSFLIPCGETVECDRDGDGYLSTGCNGDDCNDDPADGRYSHPNLSEICNDGYDNDCDGFGHCSDDDCNDSIFCPKPTPTPIAGGGSCFLTTTDCIERGYSGAINSDNCTCVGEPVDCGSHFGHCSPVVLDTRGDGFNLTSAAGDGTQGWSLT